MTAILKAMRELGIEFQHRAREVSMQPKPSEYPQSISILQTESVVIMKAEENWKPGFVITSHEWSCLRLLWADAGVQQCFLRANEYQLCDSAK